MVSGSFENDVVIETMIKQHQICEWCEWCEWYHPGQVVGQGGCRCKSPKMVTTPRGLLSCWPSVSKTDWCGEGKGGIAWRMRPQSTLVDSRIYETSFIPRESIPCRRLTLVERFNAWVADILRKEDEEV